MSKLTALICFTFLSISSAWAQTPAPSTPAPGAMPGSPPAGDAAATGSSIADYRWIILLVIIVAAAIWYFSRNRGRSRNQL
jgi:hypothetical protein